MTLQLDRVTSSSRRRISQIFSSQRRHRKHNSSSPNNSDLRFPIEIWELIIDFLSGAEARLFPLLTVHRGLHPLIERALYRHIDLSGDYVDHITRRMNLFQRLANHPHLSQLVASFVAPQPRSYYTTSLNPPLPSHVVVRYYEALHGALQSLPRLRSLSLSALAVEHVNDSSELLRHFKNILQGCNFQLVQFRLEHSIFTALPASSAFAPRVMENQGSIEDLAIDYGIDDAFPKGALPNLRILEVRECHNQVPGMLLKDDRPIRASYWRTEVARFENARLLNVRSLRLDFSRLDIVQLCLAFPSLRYLRLDEQKGRGFLARFIDWTTVDIGSLSHLRKLVLGGNAPLKWTSFALRRKITTRLFSAIPSLESISLGLELWEREKGDNVALISAPDEWKDRKWWS